VGESLFVALVVVAWVVFNGLKVWAKITEASQEPYTPPSPTGALDQLGQEKRGLDPTQREARLLELAKGEFVRALEEARRQSRVGSTDLNTYDAGSEAESLESEPEVVSLEEAVRRPGRGEFTQDAGAEQLVQQRIAAAASRDAARTRADHQEFDHRIRQEPADKTATGGYTAKQLRDAIVWREILGPPVSERREG
jgi:hypothetical protein